MKLPGHADKVRARVDAIYRNESRRVLATLIRLLGDFERAEEALHEAFAAAMAQWPQEGLPDNPRAWLVSAGRFKAIDALRRRARFDASLTELAYQQELEAPQEMAEDISDDRLRLIFTCCHPALSREAQVALTLRTVCDLTTEEIANAFLVTAPTVAQRIVRAKAKIRAARIPYQVPAAAELPERIDSVLQVIYLVFNEGYSVSAGDSVTRGDLMSEAIRLARLLLELLPDPELLGLLALMLLHHARSAARTSAAGELVLLEDQDRSLWNHEQIAEAGAMVQQALRSRGFGRYALQAAIAALHAEAAEAAATDWHEIVGLYDVLRRIDPSPVVALNRAVAVAMRDGPEAGLELVDALVDGGPLDEYFPARMARAELLLRAGHDAEAAAAYRSALQLTQQQAQRDVIQQRLEGLAERLAGNAQRRQRPGR